MSLNLEAGVEPVAGYTLIRKLGQGGFGEVWEAEAPGGVRVALKFIRLGTAQAGPELRALEVIRNIRHPHLLDVQFAVPVEDCLVVAMPLCDESLWDRLKECQKEGRPGLPRDELIGYMEELARAIDFLNEPRHPAGDGHLVGVQHRDIKPQNIFLVGGSVRLADFGLAKILEASRASHTGSMSPHYVAPEAIEGDGRPPERPVFAGGDLLPAPHRQAAGHGQDDQRDHLQPPQRDPRPLGPPGGGAAGRRPGAGEGAGRPLAHLPGLRDRPRGGSPGG